MIKPPSKLIIVCDSCLADTLYEGAVPAGELSSAIPPGGWTEILGWLEPRDGNPAKKALLNRHLCPECLPKVGPFLKQCGLHLQTAMPGGSVQEYKP